MHLARETWPHLDQANLEGRVALIPLGSTEQHGPHLPLATDHLIARALAKDAADRTEAICLPTLPVGVSSHHRQFPGTMWVDADPFRSFVENFSRHLPYHGLDRIVFVNAHGGNVEPLREVGRTLRDEEVAFAVEWMWDESIPELIAESFDRPGPHAGPKETSMILYLEPDWVAQDQLVAARNGGVPEIDLEELRVHGARTYYDAIDTSPNGAFGDPTEASAAIGERLFAAAGDALVALIEWLEDQPFEELMPKPAADSDGPER